MQELSSGWLSWRDQPLENEPNSHGAEEYRARLSGAAKEDLKVGRELNRPGQLSAPADFHSMFFFQGSIDWVAIGMADAAPIVMSDTSDCNSGGEKFAQASIEAFRRLARWCKYADSLVDVLTRGEDQAIARSLVDVGGFA